MYSSHSYERLETYFDCFARHLRDAVLPNGSLLCDLGLIKTFFPKKSSFSRFFGLKVVFFLLGKIITEFTFLSIFLQSNTTRSKCPVISYTQTTADTVSLII